MDFDPTLYNGDPVQDRVLPSKAVPAPTMQGGSTTLDATLASTSQAAQVSAQAKAQASTPKADVSEVASAAADQWWTTGMYRYITRPTFEPDDSKASEQLQQVDIQLDDDEMDFFLDGNSIQDRQWRIDSIKRDREAKALMGNRPMVAAMVAGVDPAMLAMGALTGGTGTAARLAGLSAAASRTAAAGTALVASSGAAYAVSQTRPVSTAELATGIVLETLAAPLMTFRGTKKTVQNGQIVEAPVLVPKDADFPAKALQSIAKAPEKAAVKLMDDAVPGVKPVAKEVMQTPAFGAMASGEMGDILLTPSAKAPGKFQLTHFADGVPVQDELFDSMDEAIDAFEDAVDMDGAQVLERSWKTDAISEEVQEIQATLPITPMPKALAGANPRYSYGSKGFALDFESDIDKALYIVADGVKRSKADHLYMDWLKEVTDLSETELRAAGAEIRSAIKAEAKGNISDTITVKSTRDKVMFEDVGLRAEPEYKPNIPKDLTPGVVHAPEAAYSAVVQVMDDQAKSYAARVGGSIEWNVHRSMRSFGAVGSKIADILFDNNGNLKLTSVESHIRGAHVELRNHMAQFDNLLRKAMAEDGYGMLKQIFSRKAATVQKNLEREVNLEMLRRDQLYRQGREITYEGIPERIKAMADALDSTSKKALQELQAAKVTGAEELKPQPGWASRRWNSLSVQESITKIEQYGHSSTKAKAMLIETVAKSMADANPEFTWELAHDIASSTINRALRKGAFEDAAFNINQGMDSAAQIRDLLKAEGIAPERIQRVLDVVVGKVDEQGKAGFLKHRINMDYTTNLDLGGEVINVTDLFDHGVKDIFDRYIDKTAAEVGFARKGLYSTSDIAKLRSEGVQSLIGDPAKQKEFVDLFDNSVKYMFGEAVGTDQGALLRNTAAVNRIISLGSSGYWQLTEYAKMMQQYGALKSIKYMLAEMPVFRKLMDTVSTDKLASKHLKDILETASNDSLRLQPYVRRFADGYEMPANATLSARLQHSTQLVPYLNGMKYVHGHQARVMANLTIDCINQAARGDAKMAAQLAKYGITEDMMKVLSKDVQEFGLDVDKWSATSWNNVRPAFMKMMDEGVLHARLGDTPAFALLNPAGKFLCTYRGFMLTAHNKLLAGTLQRDGLAGVSLMLLYQYPLAALAVQAQVNINGKKKLSTKELATMSLGQMGGLGMLSEVLGALTGTKKQLGAPGVIPMDRAFTFAGELGKAVTGQGNASNMLKSTAAMLPFWAILPPAKAMTALAVEELKE